MTRLRMPDCGCRDGMRAAPMRGRGTQSFAWMSAVFLVLSGCAAGPDFVAPPKPVVKGYLRASTPEQTAEAPVPGGEPQRFLPSASIPQQWWTLFRSTELTAPCAG